MKKGRPSKFNDAIKESMLKLYQEGKTDREVAAAVGVSVRALHNLKGRDPHFMHSLKEAKSVADALVEASLFSKATGYRHMEEKVFLHEGKPVKVATFKQYPPDTTAAIFWLKNRQPSEWREKHNEIVVNTETKITLSDEVLDKRIQALLKEVGSGNKAKPKPKS